LDNIHDAVQFIKEKLGYSFRTTSLLDMALTHPSAVKEGKSTGPDNQRLEYLGDAVLQLAVSQLLMESFPEAGEGDLSFLRAELVRKENLADVAIKIDLLDLVIVGPSLESAPDVARKTVAADALEALAGALFLDAGWAKTRDILVPLFNELPEPGEQLKGSKSALQEIIQGLFSGDVPNYNVSENMGQMGEERFSARVYHGDRLLGEGIGRSKKRAEEAAAASALAALKGMS
jgi:ribonuclease-3